MAAVLNSAYEKAEAAVAALPERVQQVFDLAQEKTGVQRAYFMLGFGVFAALYFIFGCFAELLCNVVGLVFFPFYWLVKVVFLVYCFLPIRPNGSTRIYNSLIHPYFLKSSGQIDTAYAKMAAKASSALGDALKQQ
ncbi:hypothetical protein HPB51_017057 [Rhipicephalus microplus]|uniref:Receptor expression-enhancing protein n=1 Tax=Rhipicephalus microplus TaxID=6941 RepID=A0A9J6F507_RHIMP|nr:hypothetical protein HPB51_017057 [Rhipicephalus microplus]